MAKTFILRFPDAAEARILRSQMQAALRRMRRDQDEIDVLKAQTRIIANQSRELLRQLEANIA